MAIETVPNTSIEDLVNQAYIIATGIETDPETSTEMDLSEFVDGGSREIKDYREPFTKALIALCTENLFIDNEIPDYIDDWFVDTAEFKAIKQVVSVQAPEVKENSAWQAFESGVTTVGSYTVYLPVVSTKFYVKTESWGLPITISGEQWDPATRSVEDLRSLVAYVKLAVKNKIIEHLKDLNKLSECAFIATKLWAQTNSVAGTHAINLVEAYASQLSDDVLAPGATFTVADYLNSADAILDATVQIGEVKDWMIDNTAIFNTDNIPRATLKDRIVLHVNSRFEKMLNKVGRSSRFNADLVSLPRYRTVASWQAKTDMSFATATGIDVDIKPVEGGEKVHIEATNVVAFISDKWAIMHTIKKDRVGHQRFDIEDLDLYEYQHRDQYMNNLSMNAVVFYLADYTKPEE